mmetsp:Transcript_30775/g.76829  ORF Transcript_30775/g.76829 Transcript_30775/m.76829 type:complete len:439 (+) Transcript_30775:146-1462(+)
MAKFGEGDGRWIVKEREDGQNCNNWHWTSKDISQHVKKTLADALREITFPQEGPLAHCSIKSCEAKGEASVNNRKGRTFLIYELELKLKWEGELRDADGAVLESSKGTIRLPDVNATELDSLDVEFESKSRGSTLSEAMRKQGCGVVKAAVQACIKQLQSEVTAQANAPKEGETAAAPRMYATPSVPVPVPQPIKVETKSEAQKEAPKMKPVTVKDAAEDSDEEEVAERPPPHLAEAVQKLKDKPDSVKNLRLSNMGIRDVHLQFIIDALHSSECHLETLDLGFNKITDAGVHVLCKAFAQGMALELSSVYLGGNKVSSTGMAMSQGLKQMRGDLAVVWKHQLNGAKSMCTVGTVYVNSPANQAGLLTGDSVVAFGPIQFPEFKSVTDSIVPVVKASVNKPIDVIVVRMDGTAQVNHIQLTLIPQEWRGAGLLGCILK